VILAGRRINGGMGKYIAEQTVKCMIQSGLAVKGGNVIVLGLTFKENCSDLRNSKVIDVIRELQSYSVTVYMHDTVATPSEARHEYGVDLVGWDELPRAGAIVAAVAHRELVGRSLDQVLAKPRAGWRLHRCQVHRRRAGAADARSRRLAP
jgi:UDP-N-acetyl-D-galactosamine dehydrogenase